MIPLVSIAIWSIAALTWLVVTKDPVNSGVIFSLVVFLALGSLAVVLLRRLLRRRSRR